MNADLAGTVTSARSGATVVVTAVAQGAGGDTIPFYNINSSNFSMNTFSPCSSTGCLGGTTAGGLPGSLRMWQTGDSGALERCVKNCTAPGASWASNRGAWTGDTQSFVLPVDLFHGGWDGSYNPSFTGGDACTGAGPTTGCGHLIGGTTTVWETVTGAASTSTWACHQQPVDPEHDDTEPG